MTRGFSVLRLTFLLALLSLLFAMASTHLVCPVVVAGRSMEPALEPGDRLLVDLWTYVHRPPAPGELVWLDGPLPAELPLIKRVRAAPPFPRDRPRAGLWRSGDVAAGPGVWVRGDNPRESGDSRAFGAVPRGRIRGRAFWRYWPPSRAGRIAPAAGE